MVGPQPGFLKEFIVECGDSWVYGRWLVGWAWMEPTTDLKLECYFLNQGTCAHVQGVTSAGGGVLSLWRMPMSSLKRGEETWSSEGLTDTGILGL